MTELEPTILFLLVVLLSVALLLLARIMDSVRSLLDASRDMRVWLRRLDEDLDSHDRLEHERFERLRKGEDENNE